MRSSSERRGLTCGSLGLPGRASWSGPSRSSPLRSPGWGGWEPWKRLELRDPIVHPTAPPGIEEAILGFALSRSLFDLAVLEALPGGRVHEAAERLGFRPSSVDPRPRSVGPDGSPRDAVLLTRSHPKPVGHQPGTPGAGRGGDAVDRRTAVVSTVPGRPERRAHRRSGLRPGGLDVEGRLGRVAQGRPR